MIKEMLTTGFILFAIGFIIYGFYLKFLRDKLFEDVMHYTGEGKPDYIEKRAKYEFNLFKSKKEDDDLIIKIKERMSYDIKTLGLSIEEIKQKLRKEGWKTKTVRRAIKKLKMEIKENGLKTKIEGIVKEERTPEPPRPKTTDSGATSTTTSGDKGSTTTTTPSSEPGTTNRFERGNDTRTDLNNRFKPTR